MMGDPDRRSRIQVTVATRKVWAPWKTALLLLASVVPMTAGAQQAPKTAAAGAPLVFDSVTVIDVEQGKLFPDQRVVIDGNHIKAVGSLALVALPKGAQVVPAKNKYLIP